MFTTMTSSEENNTQMNLEEKNTQTTENLNETVEPKAKKKSHLPTIIVIILIAVGIYYGKGYYDAKKAADLAASGPKALPAVTVVPAQQTDLFAQSNYVGRVAAIQTVEIKAQVVGEITAVNFKEGSFVRQGQLLYTLDSRKYEAIVSLRKGQLAQAKADLDRAEKFYNRIKNADERSVSKADAETAESAVIQALAGVEQANANLRLAMIDLGHTRIKSPIAGRIGGTNYTKGNYISATSGSLATVVQMDPIRVTFSMPDRDYLNQLDTFKNSGSVYNTTLRLSNGEVIDASGERDFEDNQMDQKTGSLSMRIKFRNPEGLLIPGSMVRIATKQVKSQLVTVVPQIALLADSKGDYVYVVDKDNTVQRLDVVLGVEFGTMREITCGVKAGDLVVVSGLQNIRQGVKVNVAKPAEKTSASLASQSEADNNIAASADKDKVTDKKKPVSPCDKTEPVKKEGN